MIALLRLAVLQILRSRLLLIYLVFTVFLQYVVMKGLGSLTVSFDGALAQIGPKQGLFASHFLQLISSLFLAAVYGIWMVPYWHTGGTGLLMGTLPLSKWTFPAVYATAFFSLLVLQSLLSVGIFGILHGFSYFGSDEFNLLFFASATLLEWLALLALLFAFSFGAMQFGPIPTFFLSAMFLFTLQISAAYYQTGIGERLGQVEQGTSTFHQIYLLLPPAGELVFDLKDLFLRKSWETVHLLKWLIWLALGVTLFRWKLKYPLLGKGGE